MHVKDLRYVLGCLPPPVSFLGLYLGGWGSPGLLYFGLILVPVIELFVPASVFNEPESQLQQKSGIRFYDFLLYLQVPMLYGTLAYFIYQFNHAGWTPAELVFSILNIGMLIGVSGINVAHELGHRAPAFDRWMSRLLLLPAFYSHYTLEHNYGHHLNVGTPEDPATARKNETLYAFHFRSIYKGYLNAWAIGAKMLKAKNRPVWMHELIWLHVVQLMYASIIFAYAGFGGVLALFLAGCAGVLILETVNYIEHYGLLRKKLASGRYEPMSDIHSWNSNHEIGRAMLFELVRHADHHYQTTRKYQALRHREKSPQLPFGYPMSILLAMIPPLWFRIMNPRVEALQSQ